MDLRAFRASKISLGDILLDPALSDGKGRKRMEWEGGGRGEEMGGERMREGEKNGMKRRKVRITNFNDAPPPLLRN